MKTNKSYKLSAETKANIERLGAEFKSVDDLLKTVLEVYENQTNDFTTKITNLTNEVFDISLEMERIRDHNPSDFTNEMSKSLDNLNKVWDKLRSNPYYYEN